MGDSTPIKLGIYDFFAYTVPGVFYLFTTAYFCIAFGVVTIDLQALLNLSFIQILLVAGLAYVTGFILDRIARLWDRLFRPKNLAQVVLDEFKLTHRELDFKFEGADWPILLAYLRRHDVGGTAEIERFNVTHIMLRNVSLNLLALSLIQIVQYFRTNFYIWYLVSFLVLLVLSILAAQQAARFNRWFYSANYEAIIAHGLELSNLLTRNKETSQQPTESQGSPKA
jgi:hypothetical protein